MTSRADWGGLAGAARGVVSPDRETRRVCSVRGAANNRGIDSTCCLTIFARCFDSHSGLWLAGRDYMPPTVGQGHGAVPMWKFGATFNQLAEDRVVGVVV